jgi:DNA-binding NarL/FixJ family response regulator
VSPSPWILLVTTPYDGECCQEALRDGGLRVVASENAEATLDLLDRETPLLVLLALGLLGVDAIELLGLIRRRYPTLPVFLLADRDGQVPDEDTAIRLGAQRLFLRPMDGTALAAAIEKVALEAELSIEIGEELSQITDGAELTLAPGPVPQSILQLESRGIQNVDTVPARFMRADEALPDLISPTLLGVSEPTVAVVAPCDTNIPQMRRVTTSASLPETGSLARVDVAELISTLYRAAFTGRLLLSDGQGERRLFWDGGRPIFATSSIEREGLVELLWREGKLSREQYVDARELGVRAGHRAARQLAERALIKAGEVFPLLQRQLEEVLFASFALIDGEYHLGSEPVATEDRLQLSLHPFELCLEGIRRKYGLSRLIALVGPSDTVLSPTNLLPRFVAEARLSPSERTACALLDGRRTLAEVIVTTSMAPSGAIGEASFCGLAWALCVTGAARILSDSERINGFDRAAGKHPQTRFLSDRPSELAAALAIDRERVLAKHRQVLDGDYFTILGVESTASAHEIRRASERLRAEFAPAQFAASLRSELSDALAEIQEVLVETHRVLSNDDLREQYCLHFESP